MNEPIISPWLFYWMAVAGNLKPIAFITCGVAAVVMAFAVLFSDFNLNKAMPVIKGCGLVLSISGLILVFVPSERTIAKMVVASYATPQNLEYITEKTGKAIDGGVDYMIDKIIEAADKWEARKDG